MLLDSRSQEVLDLIDQGLSMEKIAKSLNVSFTAVRNYLKKNQIRTKAEYSDVESLTPLVFELALQNLTIQEISDKTGINTVTVGKLLKSTPKVDIHARSVAALNCGIQVYKTIDLRHREYKCDKGHVFARSTNNFMQNPSCPECSPKSKGEEVFFKQISSIADFTRSVKIPSSNLEIDFLSSNIGIEYCGEYWHSSKFRDKKYHLNKALLSEKAGIRLVQFWEHEVLSNNSIVLSMINAIFQKFEKSIYARNMEVKVLDSNTSGVFFDENHLQGKTPNSWCVGLCIGDDVVAALSLRPHGNDIEIARFAVKKNHRVVGGFSRLLKYAKIWAKEQGYDTLVTFANKRYSNGDVYRRNGFEFKYLSSLDFFWIKNGKILNRRASWGKTKEFTSENGYYKVYGTGHLKFEMKL